MDIYVGATVSTPATTFDSSGEARWSQNEFPDSWESERLYGTVLERVGPTKWKVRWHYDGDVQNMDENLLEVFEDDPIEDSMINTNCESKIIFF